MYSLEEMKKLAAKGKMSRRDFVQMAVAAGATVGMAETMFTSAQASDPKRGGHLRMGLRHGHTGDTLNPWFYPDSSTQTMFWGILSNSLTQVDEKGGIVLDLVEAIDSSDNTTWSMTLRNGVTFHDGKSLTPDDVLASFNYYMREDSESPMKAIFSDIAEIKADGPNKVTFVLSAPNADFPYLVSDYKAPILPSTGDGGVDWESGNRTGAFKLESFEPGVVGRFVRNDSYHFDGRPYVDSCEVRSLPDVTSRTNALTTGEIDWMAAPDLKTLDLLSRDPNIEITQVVGYAHYVLPMLLDVAPFDDNNVRMAIKHCIDRDEIVEKIFLGYAVAGNDNPIPTSVRFGIDPQPVHKYDPDKARQYLAAAGLDSLSVDLHVSDAAFEGAVDAGQLIRESAARCGINVNVVREPEDGYWDNVWTKKPWCASYWSGRPTADWMFSTAYLSTSSWNENHQNWPEWDELLFAGRAETDPAKRAEIYAQMQQQVHDEGGQIVLVWNTIVAANSKKLGHGEIAGNWEVDGLRLAEKWWFV
ncbi:MAG: ABC transporter substrate-binding protein [Proteobacteria bacterium]|nr:ABC transporter substrate-binding protein [Pseudomonadota bacterium]MDA0951696.1 ABC transporter substrate-binding protein [Pseudomonadota bacterium]